MSPTRWKQVQSIFHAALEREPEERERAVGDLCADDRELRDEVLMLLHAHESDEQFLASPALQQHGIADAVIASERTAFSQAVGMDRTGPAVSMTQASGLVAGQELGHYKIISLLGAGGMGEVYRATDQRLNRDVALKILLSSVPTTDANVRRFEQEILAVSSLNHANVCHLYDIGTWKGRRFFTMELLEGKTLRDQMRGHALSVRDTVEYGLQIASALEAAHAKGILHRDIKPANIFVTSAGPVKVMDFGLAKRSADMFKSTGSTLSGPRTLPGSAIGTIAYMSPEQARAEDLDIRTDLFSFGVVLYEMATGMQPFRGPSPAIVLDAILNRTPVPPSQQNPEVTHELETLINTALEKDRELRYQSAAEMKAALRRLQRLHETTNTTHPVVHGPGFVRVHDDEDSGSTKSLAVLPFQLLQDREEEAYLGLGLADALITRLSGMKRLIVRPASSVFRYAGRRCDLVEAGKELGVTYVIGGLVRRSGDRVRITVQLVNVRTGGQIWATQLDETFTTLMRLEDSLASLAAEAIIPRLNEEEREQLGKRDTDNPQAHEAYLRGRYHWSKYTAADMAHALVCFMEAIARDEKYARAHAGVADYYNWAGAWNLLPPAESFAAAKQAASKALALHPDLAETQTSYGYSVWNHDWNWDEAERSFRRALELNESYGPAHSCLAYLLSAKGCHSEAVAEVERAAALDPLSPGVVTGRCVVLFHAGELDRAAEAGRAAALEGNVTAQLALAWVAGAREQHQDALQLARQAFALAPDNPWAAATMASVLAGAGEQGEARRLVAQLHERAGALSTSCYDMALIHVALNEDEEAIRCLRQAAENRDWFIRFLRVDRRMAQLHKYPAFAEICAGLGIPLRAAAAAPVVIPERETLPIKRKVSWRLLAAGLAVILVAMLAASYFWFVRDPNSPLFRAPQFTKITSTGNAILSAISPDGNYVAYALDEGGRTSLWVRQVSIANGVRIIPARSVRFRGLTFSRDGSWIFYVIYDNNQITKGTLYRIPTLGGEPRKIAEDVSSSISLSPDNLREAFLRSNNAAGRDELIVANVEGGTNAGSQTMVASRRYPQRFAFSSTPAWSPDGQTIAVASENSDSAGFYVTMVSVRVKDGAEKVLSSRRWQYIEQLAWLPGRRGILSLGRDRESSFLQIWQVFSHDAEPRRLTNDLNDYHGISLSADSSALVSAQAQTLSNVWSLSKSGESRRITLGYGRYFDLTLAGDKIVYASDSSGHADLWSMDLDGTNQRQLTSNAHRNYSPAGSPDGRYIAFHSNRSGTWNIWRMNRDGGDLKQLTSDAADSNWPVWTPDGRYILYHHIGENGYQTIWKVPADGGVPGELTSRLTLRPTVSPRDGTVACWYAEDAVNRKWKIAILPGDGGEPLRTFEFPATASVDSTLRWTPDGKGITYTDVEGDLSSIWVQNIEGGPPHKIATFNGERIFSLDWNRSGELLFSRGLRMSDIVLITDAK